MERSLAVLLPVHNAAATLERNVARALEIATELSERFEVLVVDDASNDATEEVAHDLARRYPQVRVVRHESECGLVESIQTGLRNISGEIVFVRDREGELDQTSIERLWRLRDDEDVALARDRDPASGIQMIRRSATAELDVEQIARAQPTGTDARKRRWHRTEGGEPSRPSVLFRVREFVMGE